MPHLRVENAAQPSSLAGKDTCRYPDVSEALPFSPKFNSPSSPGSISPIHPGFISPYFSQSRFPQFPQFQFPPISPSFNSPQFPPGSISPYFSPISFSPVPPVIIPPHSLLGDHRGNICFLIMHFKNHNPISSFGSSLSIGESRIFIFVKIVLGGRKNSPSG